MHGRTLLCSCPITFFSKPAYLDIREHLGSTLFNDCDHGRSDLDRSYQARPVLFLALNELEDLLQILQAFVMGSSWRLLHLLNND
jgi:hypothetical protein